MKVNCTGCGIERDVERSGSPSPLCWKCSRAQNETLRKQAEESRIAVGRVRREQCWPMYSCALGSLPKSRDKHREFHAKHGLPPPEYDSAGNLKIESRQHRNAILKARRLTDFDAGYGDHVGDD